MSISAKHRAVSSCLILATLLYASNPVSAANVFMLDISGTGARNFSDSTIWPSGVLPTSADNAVIDFGDGTTDYVYIDAATTTSRFNIGNVLSGGVEIRTGATWNTVATGTNQANLGQHGVGQIRIQSGATLSLAGLLNVGLNEGTGTITLENGGTHTVGLQLGLGGQGTATYNMLGGSLTIGSYLQIASQATGNGAFKQSGGALQINRTGGAGQQGLHIATTAGGTGLYEISAGSLTIANTNPGIINGTAGTAGGSFGTFRIIGSVPTITIGKDYTQRKDSKLDVVIGAGGISLMNLGGNAILDGILSASFTSTPTVGQEFQIIKYAGTRTGTFASFDSLVDSPLGPDTVQLAVDYGSGTNDVVKLTVSSLESAHPGDFDSDGDVDGADFVAWQTHFPTPTNATRADGDADNDGDVDGADFVVWQTNFPFTPGPAVSTVPEPTAILLLSFGGLFVIAANRRHRR